MLTASIVSYHHSPAEIRKVIDCVLDSPVSVLYIVDNSLNDSLRSLEHISDKIRYIHSVNLGYGSGHNIAIREAVERESIYHIVINPDIYFEKGMIEELVTYMNNNRKVGLVMPKVLYPDGSVQYLCKLLPTPMDLIGRRFIPLKRYVDKKNVRYELRFADYNSLMNVPSLSGCFMFIRTEAIKEAGVFDERYFMYAEDLDLCRRIGEVAETIYYPKVHIYHEYAKGSYHSIKLLRYHLSSLIKYFNKWGWLVDKKRKRINNEILGMLGYKG